MFFSRKSCYKIQLYTGLHDVIKQGARFRRLLIAADYVITPTRMHACHGIHTTVLQLTETAYSILAQCRTNAGSVYVVQAAWCRIIFDRRSFHHPFIV